MSQRSDDPLICDGCAVASPHEHRCHGLNAHVMGENTGQSCECLACASDEEIAIARTAAIESSAKRTSRLLAELETAEKQDRQSGIPERYDLMEHLRLGPHAPRRRRMSGRRA